MNGRLIFSKARSGRFPLDDEVEETFEALREGRAPSAPESAPQPAGFVNRILGKLSK